MVLSSEVGRHLSVVIRRFQRFPPGSLNMQTKHDFHKILCDLQKTLALVLQMLQPFPLRLVLVCHRARAERQDQANCHQPSADQRPHEEPDQRNDQQAAGATDAAGDDAQQGVHHTFQQVLQEVTHTSRNKRRAR